MKNYTKLFCLVACIASFTAPVMSLAADAGGDFSAMIAKADVAKGKATAQVCAACHSFDKGGPNKVGPTLWGVVDRERASVAGFSYSQAFTAMKGQKWSQQDLYTYLESPMTYAKGTKMAFAGVKNPQDRANVVAWLATLK